MSQNPSISGTELFATSNRFLAKALAFAGFVFSPYREYDKAYLSANGCKTIKDAERRKLAGRETWFFVKTRELVECVSVYDEENDAIDELVKSGADIPFLEQSKRTTRCREFVRAFRGSREVDATLWKTKPFLRYWDEGDGSPSITSSKAGSMASFPASKLIPIDAKEEIKRHLGL